MAALVLRSSKIAEKMACCPEGALGQLGTQGYVCKVRVTKTLTFNKCKKSIYTFQGTVERVQDLDLYYVGSGPKCIIWNYDIFGFDSGRTR